MAAYIAFIASFNLCLGYALGVYVGVMPGITPRNARKSGEEEDLIGLNLNNESADDEQDQSELEEDEPLLAPPTEPEPLLSATEDSEEEDEATLESESEEEASDPADEVEEEEQNNFANILQGLEAFKSKLDSVSEKLNSIDDDRSEMDECANELKQANNDYLDKASEAMDEFNEADPDTVTEEEQHLQETLVKQSAEVKQANDDIDDILAEEDNEKVRQKLLDTTDQLAHSAEEVEEAIPEPKGAEDSAEELAEDLAEGLSEEPVEESAEESLDLSDLNTDDLVAEVMESDSTIPSSLGTLDQLLDQIDRSISEDGPATLLQVGAIDVLDETGGKGEHIKRMLTGLESIVAGELALGQTMAIDDESRFLLYLPGDDQKTADERCERVRQRIAAATFHHNGQETRGIARCAIVQAAGAIDSEVVQQRLGEALTEAKNLGESCTVHHDGTSCELVPAMEMDVPEVCVKI
ncbi:hypothetical protein [Aeoliella mucimassa]|uniref:GGDEF domain-containing protein n=1 Tax=Aeoliella mucimassa TaxID=2527972 RepID=A0A518AVH4_9BACT|nr:hypothetical protein [Aeoliella mucimassa]QDU58720.1 hypothetical protein Pan181_49600 [Aeoliella mucimassa]